MIGVDEVGRGCLAGPLLVVAARQVRRPPKGLADSKVLTRERRQGLMHAIQQSCELGEGWVASAEIDALGLGGAMRLGVERALKALSAQHDEPIILDGNVQYCPPEYVNAQCVIDADATHQIVSAASIYAKVTRDNFMIKMAEQHPAYHFHKHVGYGTKLHLEALKLQGACELHRLSFKPVSAVLA